MSNNSILGENIKRVHFIGIGGISMNGLAEILGNQGYIVSGSDMRPSPITEKLKSNGMTISYGHSSGNINNQDLVVYTAAVRDTNPEIIRAGELGIPLMDRAMLLGKIMQTYDKRIAISGTHGKTTTTSMISLVLMEADFNPTLHLGGELEAIEGSTRVGGAEYFVTEACEYVESFLKFYPNLAVLLNIEPDHLDYFKDIDHIKNAFKSFIGLVPKNGAVVANIDDENVLDVVTGNDCKVITYGLNSANAYWTARNILFDDNGCGSFNLVRNKKVLTRFKISVPGIHNVGNALACIAACDSLGCSLEVIREGLRKFTGTHRRFEVKGIVDNIKVVDDYAHHPTEVKATLKASRNCTHGRIICVFQPHTYTRTKALIESFSESFTLADEVIITDIYAAREADTGIIHAKDLTERINVNYKNATYISEFKDIVSYLEQITRAGDFVITMGAGDVYKVGEMFLREKHIKAVV